MKRLTTVVKSVRESVVWHFLGELFDTFMPFVMILIGGIVMYDSLAHHRGGWSFASGLLIVVAVAIMEAVRRVREAISFAREHIIAEVHRDRDQIIAAIQERGNG